MAGRRTEPLHGPLGQSHPASPDGLAGLPAPQVLGQVGGAGVPPAGILLQALQAHRLQVARRFALQTHQRHGLVLDHLGQCFHHRGRSEGRPPGETLVENGPQRIRVRCGPDVLLALGLLRRHVRRRTHHRARLRQAAAALDAPSEAEVRNLGFDRV